MNLLDSCGAELLLMDEKKSRQAVKQMGLHLMGTVGMSRAAYEDKLLSYEDIMECVKILRANGRQISDRLYGQLMNPSSSNRLKDESSERIYQYFDEINADPIAYRWTYKMDDIDSDEAKTI